MLNKKNIESKLKLLGMRQGDLASQCKMTQPQLSEYLSGKRDITLEKAIRIADALGVPLEQIIIKKTSDLTIVELYDIFQQIQACEAVNPYLFGIEPTRRDEERLEMLQSLLTKKAIADIIDLLSGIKIGRGCL